MTFLTNPILRKLDSEKQLEIKSLIYKELCNQVNLGHYINKAELLVGKELQISSSIIGQVSATKKFREFYQAKKNR